MDRNGGWRPTDITTPQKVLNLPKHLKTVSLRHHCMGEADAEGGCRDRTIPPSASATPIQWCLSDTIFRCIDKFNTLWGVVISVGLHDRYTGLIALGHGMARKQSSSVRAVIFQSSSIMTVSSKCSPWDHRWIDRNNCLEPASSK